MQAPAARSYWLREGRNGAPRHEALARDLDVDAAIVGAGITGLTLATLLIEAGLRVALLERRRVAGGTTSRSTAHLTAALDTDYCALEERFGEAMLRTVGDSVRGAIGSDRALRAVERRRLRSAAARPCRGSSARTSRRTSASQSGSEGRRRFVETRLSCRSGRAASSARRSARVLRMARRLLDPLAKREDAMRRDGAMGRAAERAAREITTQNKPDHEVVRHLQRQVANAFLLYANYERSHWQNYGPQFRDLHLGPPGRRSGHGGRLHAPPREGGVDAARHARARRPAGVLRATRPTTRSRTWAVRNSGTIR